VGFAILEANQLHMKYTRLGILLATLTGAGAVCAALTPVDLRCDYAVNPLGVDSAPPRLFWQLAGDARGLRQSAYEILVARTPAAANQNQGWDSGRIASDQTAGILFPGANLKSSQQFFWKVRVWDQAGHVSDWSPAATWTMGVLSPEDWHARWVSAGAVLASTCLRREWVVHPGLTRALVNVCGLGQYELTINGRKAGDNFLAPGWSEYSRTCLYDTLDITAALQPGTNAAGLLLGNGMFNVFSTSKRYAKFQHSFGPQQAIAQIRLEYADGHVEIIGTDEHWRVAPGPITFSSIYGGEDEDARLVQSGWDSPGFNEAAWAPAVVVPGPGGRLRGQSCAAPPVRTFEVHAPVASHSLTNGNQVFDLGQNASHLPTIRVSGPVGSRIRLAPAELINPNGTISQGSMGKPGIWCEYTKSTAGVEEWTPRFYYAGCRYYEAVFRPAAPRGAMPRLDSLTAAVVSSASDPVGVFECSNPLFNRIHKLIRWAQRSNMVSILTDCPHRERLGWLEQTHLNGPALRYEFDLAQLATKMLNDIADSQLHNGLVPATAPEYPPFDGPGDRRNDFGDSPEWSSSFILVPWQQYEFDGDLALFRLHYDAMARYLAYLGTRAQSNIVSYGLGDWYDIGPRRPGRSQLTPDALPATAYYYEDATILAQVATLLGKTNDARTYASLAQNIRTAFNQRFYNPAAQTYATGSQCANAIPLVMGLCEPTNRPAILAALFQNVRSHGLTAGDIGYRYLLRALADGGRSDVIFDLNNQSDKPGYGYQLKHGATSLTEAWDAGPSSSQNHFMLGQLMEWFYHDLGGIASDPAGPGFQRILINPQPVGDVTWVRTRYHSIRGLIICDWERFPNRFDLHLTIPPNTTATVFLPARPGATVTEGGRPADQSDGVKFLRSDDDRAVYAVASGRYDFSALTATK
jgi:hypothetical protein